eukprot:858105-Pleurochrysis_carterae.AAC.1
MRARPKPTRWYGLVLVRLVRVGAGVGCRLLRRRMRRSGCLRRCRSGARFESRWRDGRARLGAGG